MGNPNICREFRCGNVSEKQECTAKKLMGLPDAEDYVT